MNLVKLLNNYIDKNKIWENLEKNKISTLVLSLKNILNLINPIFPNLSKEINQYFIVKNKYFINQKIKLRPIF
jgi:methionyl-tRNA synthetase